MKPRYVVLSVASVLTLAGAFYAAVVWAPVPGGRAPIEWQEDLNNPSLDVRVQAVKALATFEDRAVPALTRALSDKEHRVRSAAVETLSKIGPGPVVPSMLEALKSPEVPVRANAVVVLGAFGPVAMPAIPALAQALKDSNPRVQELADEAMTRITASEPNDPVAWLLGCH